jgi:hypothetical protein
MNYDMDDRLVWVSKYVNEMYLGSANKTHTSHISQTTYIQLLVPFSVHHTFDISPRIMPPLNKISYSRDAVVAAVRDYYSFLVDMYLPESLVLQAPDGGWPSITSDTWTDFDKSDEVIALLRHLPYITHTNYEEADGAPECKFADWQSLTRITDGEQIRILTEIDADEGVVPAHVVGLTIRQRDVPSVILLDTELGLVYWPNCPGPIKYSPARETFMDDPDDWAEVPGAEWRSRSAIWAVEDFFEVLKFHFRQLEFVPLSARVVQDVWTGVEDGQHDDEGMLPAVQGIYRSYGWPDLARYRKRDCLKDVRVMLQERFPDEAEGIVDEEDAGED